MNGDWYDPFGQSGRWYFQQEGNLVTGWMKNPMPNPNCGAIVASGVVDPASVILTITPAVANQYCNFNMDVHAIFSPNCEYIEGNWTYKENGKVEYGSLLFLRNPLDIIEPIQTQFVIPNPPQMPSLLATAVIVDNSFRKFKTSIPVYSWSIRIHNPYIPNRTIRIESDIFETNNPTYQPNFNLLTVITEPLPSKPNEPPRPLLGGIIGGDVALSVEYFQNVRYEKDITILGTNPGQAAIEQMITDKTLRQIACTESRYRQFKGQREGGVGYPMGDRCGVGIMQLCDPHATPEQAWDWRENIKGGIIVYNSKRLAARLYPKKVLELLNEKRKKKRLGPCESLPPFNAEQLERETIRRYNCGAEYQWKPLENLGCKGQWVIDPSCRITNPNVYNPTYVDSVLACDINH